MGHERLVIAGWLEQWFESSKSPYPHVYPSENHDEPKGVPARIRKALGLVLEGILLVLSNTGHQRKSSLGEDNMLRRTIQAALFVVAVAAMTVPFSCQNASSAGTSERARTYNLYFGDLHTHTGYSDAYEDSTPWDAYEAAIAAGADFMAVTDHIAIWHDYEAWISTPEEWHDCLAAADHYTSRKFVAMAGYEAWLLGNVGEINVYNTRELPSWQLGYRQDRLPSFYDWLAQQPGAIGQFNHPLYVSDNFMDFAYYTPSRDSGMNIIEVYNDEFTEESYVMALDAGWHLMPSANSDTHYSDWIAGHEMRTVLLAESLTSENLYAAMSACRGYATLDKDLQVYYTLNGAVMGSVLSPASKYEVSVKISDPDGAVDAIRLVEIVSDGGEVVASMDFDSEKVQWTTTLTSNSAQYFYVRVTTASDLWGVEGVTAWTAPVWTGR
jgi:hypothetical protein